MKSKEDCRKFFEKISEFIDGELDAKERTIIEEHIKECEPCLKYVDSIKKVKECLKLENENCSEQGEIIKKCLKKFLSQK